MNILWMTVGLPRSGKSTWAISQTFPIVNPDSIRLALHGQPFIGSAEPFVWAIAKCMVNALFIAGHRNVILDATNTTRQRRDQWKSDNWSRKFVKFLGSIDKQICINRAIKSCPDIQHREDLIRAITRMAETWEDLQPEEIELAINYPDEYPLP